MPVLIVLPICHSSPILFSASVSLAAFKSLSETLHGHCTTTLDFYYRTYNGDARQLPFEAPLPL